MKRVLVTGSEGYIGKHLIKMMGDHYEIHKLDKIDPINPIDITKFFEYTIPFDAVIHLAALVNVSKSTKYPIDYFETNTNGTLTLLKKLNFKHFVFASTGSAEGLASPYALSKKMAELIVEDYCQQTNKNYTMFRFYNVTGTDGIPPTNPDGLMASLIRAKTDGFFNIYGTDYNTLDGTAIRDYIHVNEICASLIKSIDNPSNSLENLGHGIGTSVAEMIKIYKRVNDVDFEVRSMPRRPGELEVSVLGNVSPYMTKMYTIEDLLKHE